MNAAAGPADGEAYQRARQRARTDVYERFALISAVIWTVGAALLLNTIVPDVPHPQAYIAAASVVPIVPAALPWIWYRHVVETRARELLAEEAAQRE